MAICERLPRRPPLFTSCIVTTPLDNATWLFRQARNTQYPSPQQQINSNSTSCIFIHGSGAGNRCIAVNCIFPHYIFNVLLCFQQLWTRRRRRWTQRLRTLSSHFISPSSRNLMLLAYACERWISCHCKHSRKYMCVCERVCFIQKPNFIWLSSKV